MIPRLILLPALFFPGLASPVRAESATDLEKVHAQARAPFDGAAQLELQVMPPSPVAGLENSREETLRQADQAALRAPPVPNWPIPRSKLDLPLNVPGKSLYPGDPEREKRFKESLRANDGRGSAGHYFGIRMGPHVAGAIDPAYRFAELLGDGVFSIVVLRGVSNILPSQVAQDLERAPDDSSVETFHRELRIETDRVMRRMRDSYPVRGGIQSGDAARDNEFNRWKNEFLGEMGSAGLTAFERTMLERLNVNMLQRTGEECARDKACRRDPRVMGLGLVVLGALGWFDGFHISQSLGPVHAFADVKSAEGLVNAFKNDGTKNRAVGLGLGYNWRRVSALYTEIYTDWMVDHGQMRRSISGTRFNYRW